MQDIHLGVNLLLGHLLGEENEVQIFLLKINNYSQHHDKLIF